MESICFHYHTHKSTYGHTPIWLLGPLFTHSACCLPATVDCDPVCHICVLFPVARGRLTGQQASQTTYERIRTRTRVAYERIGTRTRGRRASLEKKTKIHLLHLTFPAMWPRPPLVPFLPSLLYLSRPMAPLEGIRPQLAKLGKESIRRLRHPILPLWRLRLLLAPPRRSISPLRRRMYPSQYHYAFAEGSPSPSQALILYQ